MKPVAASLASAAWWRDTARAALNLVYPPLCAGCEDRFDFFQTNQPVCKACESQLKRIQPPYCAVCGEGYSADIDGPFQCSNCAGRKLAFDFAVAGYEAKGLARDLIHQFKYEKQFHLCRPLARMMEAALEDERIDPAASWLVTAVPLHPRRERERHYNQAHELARVFARSTGFPLVKALCRTRHTDRQATLHRDERLKNLKGAFGLRRDRAARRKLDGANVLLVDDVLTTGATTSECAKVLRNEGRAAKVVVITVARG